MAIASSAAPAQGYPAKPVRLIVADAAGGAPDQLARVLAKKLTENLGQQVIVDNRPGAAGALGADIAARSPADGYTLLLTTTAIYAILPSLKKNLRYDPVRDFVPISRIATASNVLVVNVAAARASRSPSWCSSRRASPASSTMPPPASARRRISRARCSTCSPASS